MWRVGDSIVCTRVGGFDFVCGWKYVHDARVRWHRICACCAKVCVPARVACAVDVRASAWHPAPPFELTAALHRRF